jgi:site-specific DNA-cytosine methylase
VHCCISTAPAKQHLPDGPKTMHEAHQWHIYNATTMLRDDPLCGDNFVQNASGAVLRSFFSGMDCFGMGTHQQATGFACGGHPLTCEMIIEQTTDIDKQCRYTLLHRHRVANHVGGDINDRLTVKGARLVAEAERHNEIDKGCVFGETDLTRLNERQAKTLKNKIAAVGVRCIDRLMKAVTTLGALRGKVRCYKHEKSHCSFDFEREPNQLLADVSGTMCTPWSSMGLMLGFCDVTTARVFAIWLADVMRVQPDIVLHENVPGFKWQIIQKYLHGYTVESDLFVLEKHKGDRILNMSIIILNEGMHHLNLPRRNNSFGF